MSYPLFNSRVHQRPWGRYASRFRRFNPGHWFAISAVIFGATALLGYTATDATTTDASALIQTLNIPLTPPGVSHSDQPFLHQAETAALEEILTARATAASKLLAPSDPLLEIGSQMAVIPSAVAAAWKEAIVAKGDNLSQIFARSGISAVDLDKIMTLGAAVNTLKRIYPGQTLQLRADDAGRLQELRYEESPTLGLLVRRKGDNFTATSIHRVPDREVTHASSVIKSSLFESGQEAGMTDGMTMDLAGIFGWDIDFALDIREGDRFTVIYDELYLDGERVGEGHILAAEFINQGQVYRAIRYTDAEGHTAYYTPDGHSLRRAFLRTPVEFSRISSGFNLKRKHPILNRIRAHKGVDYAAPQGTPVKTTGDGRIVFRGVKGGYGNVVVIQHGSTYSTLYAHLSGFARTANVGTRVRQGQTIGYLGMTGLATGPHLHYEFLVNGAHRNPLTVKFPEAMPIEARFRHDFQKQAKTLLAQLDEIRANSQVALNER